MHTDTCVDTDGTCGDFYPANSDEDMGRAGHFGALDVEFHLALSDGALRGLSTSDLLIPGGDQDDWCALLGPGSAVDVCA